MQWLWDPNQSNVDNPTTVRPEASRHFRNKKKEYLKAKINELENNSKIKNISALCRASVTLRRATSLELNVVKDEKGDLIAVSYRILARWRKHFCQVLNVHGFVDVRQAEIQTSEPLMPVPSAFEVEMDI
jgi:hypothetical protein